MFHLMYTPAARRSLKKIKDREVLKRCRDAIEGLSKDPYVGIKRVGDLSSVLTISVHYKKMQFRIAYQIDEEIEQILIILVDSRENFYQKLKRYMKELGLSVF